MFAFSMTTSIQKDNWYKSEQRKMDTQGKINSPSPYLGGRTLI